MPRCPNCGKDNPDDARFCAGCATAMSSLAFSELRKTVTVVFADLADSTSLGERLDPETLRRVIARYYEGSRTALERHGGTVAKFIGDAVMGVFGIPKLHEDDALRAVRAAAETQHALQELNEELDQRYGVRLQARIGVNTGEVVADDAHSGESFLVGDAVNLAARLEQLAEPEQILLGSETHALVCDAVEAERVETVEVKGKSEPVTAYRLIGIKADALGHVRRLDSRLVGRESELATLRETFEQAVTECGCRLVTVLGPPGVGKSRLAQELVSQLGHEARVVRGRCIPYGEGVTYWPIAEIVREVAGIDEDDSRAEVRAKIVPLLPGDEDPESIADGIAEALGLSETVLRPEQLFFAIRKLFEALAQERPLLVVFDDIHWGEPTFHDLIEYLAGFSHGRSITLLCVARPELMEDRPYWGATVQLGRVLSLEPLDAGDSRVLIDHVLGEGELADDVAQRIIDSADGNPLFVEEMLRMLIDDGQLVKEDGHWAATGELSEVAVPPTIRALLAARLDRLSSPERAVVECASVVGQVFWRGAVVELSPDVVRTAVWTHLQSLLRKELIRPDHTPFLAEEDAFRFGHVLVRDAAYEAMLKQARADLHERFADWLEERGAGRLSEYQEILGYHFEQSVRIREGLGETNGHDRGLAERAARHLGAAGDRAFARADMPAAVKLLERSLSLLGEEDPSRPALSLKLGLALAEAGPLERADGLMETAARLSRAAGDRSLELHCEIEVAALRVLTDSSSDLHAADRLSHEAIEYFTERGDEHGLARAWLLLAARPMLHGRLAEATEALERALAHAQNAGDASRAGRAFQWLIVARFMGPTRAEEAISRSEEYVKWAGDTDSAQGGLLILRGGFEAMAGNFDTARDLIGRGQSIYEQLGLRHKLATAMSVIGGTAEMTIGDAAAAEALVRPAYETLKAMGERGWLPATAAMVAHALVVQGRDPEAEKMIAISEATAHHDDVWICVTSRITRALLIARQGDLEAANTLAGLAMELARKTDWLMLRAYVALVYGLLLQQAGSVDEAGAHYREALEACEQKGDVVTAKRARFMLERLA